MNRRATRLALAAAFMLANVLNVLGPPTSAVAEHLPPPSDIVLRVSELPPGFAPADEAGAPSLLPDGLARQATVSFRRDPERASDPGMDYVKQVVLTFDERAASEYLPRFRDLMLRHQGYTASISTESDFHLTRTRGTETSIVVGVAHSEVLVVTTVAGQAGTVSSEQAAQLTGLAVARVPVVDQSSAALSTAQGGVALADATTGGKQFEYPSIEEKGRWPVPSAQLPRPADLDVVAQRSQRPVGDSSLDNLTPIGSNRVRPPDVDRDLVKYTNWIIPLIDEFWARSLDQTGHYYWSPRIVMVREEVLLLTPCIDGDGLPAPVLDIFYCPLNETMYIYEPFLRDDVVASENWQEKAISVAVLLGHEWGHHIQKTHGYQQLDAINRLNQPDMMPWINRQAELHADCFSGLFVRYARDAGWLALRDVHEAQEVMLRLGDTEFDNPDHHGTPGQRKEWFMRGYVHYSLRACDAW